MTDDKEKCEKYLYLFILSTKQQMLVEPFNDPPKSMNSKWDDFDKEYTLQDIKNSVLKQNGLDLITPQYKIDISRDLMEYVAYQEIPNFGCHFYYAFSLQQLPNWQKFSKFKVPKKLISTLFTTNFPIPPQDDDDDDDDDDNDEEETTTPEYVYFCKLFHYFS